MLDGTKNKKPGFHAVHGSILTVPFPPRKKRCGESVLSNPAPTHYTLTRSKHRRPRTTPETCIHAWRFTAMKQEGPLDRLRRVCGRIYPKLSSLFRATRPPPAPAARFEKEKETRGNHVVKSLWKPPVEVEATSPAVSLAALELDIMLIDKMVRKLFRALLHGDSDGTMLSTQTPEGRAFIHQQLDELRAEKARYKEEKLALLEKLDNRGGSDHLALISGTPAILFLGLARQRDCQASTHALTHVHTAVDVFFSAMSVWFDADLNVVCKTGDGSVDVRGRSFCNALVFEFVCFPIPVSRRKSICSKLLCVRGPKTWCGGFSLASS